MTTIAIKNGIIAYDSRLTRGDTILDDNYNKKIEQGGVIFFCYGTLTGSDRLIEAYLNKNIEIPIEANALVIDDNKVWHIGYDPDSEPSHIWKTLIGDRSEAFGSGEAFAFTAMDMGASAKKAILMAAKRDLYTNDNVNIHRVNNYENSL